MQNKVVCCYDRYYFIFKQELLYDYCFTLLEVKRVINYDTLCSNVLFVKIEALKNVKTIEIEHTVCIWGFV